MRVLGIDAGTATVGCSVLDITAGAGQIVACSTHTFDAPETDQDRRPTNGIRREEHPIKRSRVKIDQLLRDADWSLSDGRSVRSQCALDDAGSADCAPFTCQSRVQ